MKSTRTAILVILLFFLDVTTAKLFVSLQQQVKREHDSIIVVCKDDNTKPVRWMKEHRKGVLGEKTTPMAKETMHGLQLIFSDIKKEDAGTYICRSESDSERFELFVEPKNILETTTPHMLPLSGTNRNPTSTPSTTPGPIIFVNTDKNVTGKEGSDIFMRCEARGATLMEWLVNGEKPTEDSKYITLGDGLVIQNAIAEDADNEFVCKATNEHSGDFQLRNIKLTVTHKPRRYARQEFAYGYMGGVVELKCEVLAVPPANITWYRRAKDKKILTGRVIHQDLPGVSTSVLKLVLKEPSDLGDYKCVAANSEGTIDELFKVMPGTKPKPPISLSVEEVTTNSVTLMVEVPPPTEQEHSTNMAPTGVRIEYRPENETKQWEAMSFTLAEDKMYIVPNLTNNTTYQVRAATKNIAGFSDFIDPIKITTSSAVCIIYTQAHLTIVFSVLILLFNNSSNRLILCCV